MLPLLDAGLPAPAAGAFTTRLGGVSAAPWDALDLGLHAGDDAAAVAVNRARLAAAVGVAEDRLALPEQVHGTGVAVVRGADAAAAPAAGTDALVTTEPGLALLVLAADCLPVLLADPRARVVAAAHAGRQGLADGVLQETLAVMAGVGARTQDTVAVLGPAVCGGCYELPQAVADEVERAVPGSRATTRAGTPSVDLADGAHALLVRAGVGRVTRVGGCTLEQPERFFSYRRDGRTGRHGGVVRLLP